MHFNSLILLSNSMRNFGIHIICHNRPNRGFCFMLIYDIDILRTNTSYSLSMEYEKYGGVCL